MTADGIGRGYLQREFQYICSCGFLIDKARLAAVKFVHDLVLDPTSAEDRATYGNQVYLA